ncbi:MAG: hypothetical protein ACREBW_07990 [Candidatus Micrarchaeaceae archaeon]
MKPDAWRYGREHNDQEYRAFYTPGVVVGFEQMKYHDLSKVEGVQHLYWKDIRPHHSVVKLFHDKDNKSVDVVIIGEVSVTIYGNAEQSPDIFVTPPTICNMPESPN